MNRLSFFFQQLVGQADLNTLQDDIENAERSIVADILGYGFLVGAVNVATVAQNTSPDLNVKVNRLLGYDQNGKRLSNLLSGYQGNVNKGAPPPQLVDMSVDEVSASTAVSGVGNEKKLSIFVKFVRNPSTPRTDGNNATVYYNQDESVQFNVVQSAEAGAGLAVLPPLRSDQILLADVTITHGQTTITTGDISQSRRQAFQLLLPHGTSHISTGSDPVPNAVASGASGLMSGSDKAKLDSITSPFDDWIGAQLIFQYAQHKPATITAPSATTLDVTSRLNAIAAGGSTTKEGVVTQSQAADSIVELWDSNNSEIRSPAGNRIYGKVSVDNETSPTAWTLSFYTKVAGVETAFDFTGTSLAGATLTWAVTRSYRLDNLPQQSKATWLNNRNNTVGIPAVKAQRNGAGTTNPEPIVNFIQGSNVTLTVADNPGAGRIDVTIAASAAGGFPGFGSATNPDTSGGSGGGTGVAADAGHQHSASTVYRHTSGSTVVTGTGLPSSSIGSLGVAIAAFAAIASAAGGGSIGAISVGFYDSAGNQRSVYLGSGGSNGSVSGKIADTTVTGAGGGWVGSGMGTGTISLSASGGAAAAGVALAIGSPH